MSFRDDGFTDGTSEKDVWKIPDGCPTCGAERAIDGHDDTPVCVGCGEALTHEDVELNPSAYGADNPHRN